MVAFFRAAVEKAVREGHPGVRASVESPVLAAGGPTLEAILDYQERVLPSLRALPLTAIWSYPRRTLPRALARHLLLGHERILHGGAMHRNSLFLAGGDAEVAVGAGAELERLIEVLTSRARAEDELADGAHLLRRALDGARFAEWHWDAGDDHVRCNRRFAELLGLAPPPR